VAAWQRAIRKNRSGQATATVWDYSMQIWTLGYYIEFTGKDPATLNSQMVSDIEGSFNT